MVRVAGGIRNADGPLQFPAFDDGDFEHLMFVGRPLRLVSDLLPLIESREERCASADVLWQLAYLRHACRSLC